MSSIFLRASFAVALIAGGAGAQDSLALTDPKEPDPNLAHSDAVSFSAKRVGADLKFEVQMAKPLVEGMFTCVHVYFDADNNPKTGIEGGAEFWLRSSVGSRYHPMNFVPKKGPKAISIRRTSFSKVERRSVDAEGEPTWLHVLHDLPCPPVEGNKILFSMPIDVLRQHGARYGTIAGLRVAVETTCSDQPLMVRHLCGDEGMDPDVDGSDEDWSHAGAVKDPKGELHAVAQPFDLVSLRAEHGPNHVYMLAEFAEPGVSVFRRPADVLRWDRVTFFVEPTFPRYQSPVKFSVRPSRRGQGQSVKGLKWAARCGTNLVEARLQRRSGQNGFRIWAWSDVIRTDRIGEYTWSKFEWRK